MHIILGSQSKSRRELLAKLGYEFEVRSADIDERAIRSTDYQELPLLIARAKAEALLPQITEDAILITADLVVVWHGELREKPESEAEVRRFLESYSEHSVQTNGALVVHNTATGKRAEAVNSGTVYFKRIPESVIQQIIDEGNGMTGAGGFRVEDPLLAPYIERVEGEMEGIMGLSLIQTKQLIAEVQ